MQVLLSLSLPKLCIANGFAKRLYLAWPVLATLTVLETLSRAGNNANLFNGQGHGVKVALKKPIVRRCSLPHQEWTLVLTIGAQMTERPLHTRSKARSFSTLLRVVSNTHPKMAVHLFRAQANRQKSLSQYVGGARLRGYEELIDHLEKLEAVFQRSHRLNGISQLIRRIRGDFQLALEATLSGFHSVAHDSMRNVMEVQFLLREFFYDPARIEEWLHATHKDLNDKFRPAVLRQRHAKRLGMQPDDVAEATDYRGHSRLLHVSPYPRPFGGSGFSGPDGPFDSDVCFWEMFEHGRRVLFEAHRLRRKLARHIKSPWGPRRGLKSFRDAWQRTQEMQAIWMALLQATSAKGNDHTE